MEAMRVTSGGSSCYTAAGGQQYSERIKYLEFLELTVGGGTSRNNDSIKKPS